MLAVARLKEAQHLPAMDTNDPNYRRLYYVRYADDKHASDGRRRVNAHIGLRVPIDVIKKKRAYYMRKGKPMPRSTMIADDDFSILSRYQEEYRGVVQ